MKKGKRGIERIRTAVAGFADLSLTTRPRYLVVIKSTTKVRTFFYSATKNDFFFKKERHNGLFLPLRKSSEVVSRTLRIFAAANFHFTQAGSAYEQNLTYDGLCRFFVVIFRSGSLWLLDL